MGSRGGRTGSGDMGDVTSWKSFLDDLGGAKSGSEDRATGQGPFAPIHVKLNLSRDGAKKRT